MMHPTEPQAQMTLGKLIVTLKGMDSFTLVPNLCHPHSYRGYYHEIAFELNYTTHAHSLLATCERALGETYQGWKGGDYTMGDETPVWVAERGSTGFRLMALRSDGSFELSVDQP